MSHTLRRTAQFARDAYSEELISDRPSDTTPEVLLQDLRKALPDNLLKVALNLLGDAVYMLQRALEELAPIEDLLKAMETLEKVYAHVSPANLWEAMEALKKLSTGEIAEVLEKLSTGKITEALDVFAASHNVQSTSPPKELLQDLQNANVLKDTACVLRGALEFWSLEDLLDGMKMLDGAYEYVPPPKLHEYVSPTKLRGAMEKLQKLTSPEEIDKALEAFASAITDLCDALVPEDATAADKSY